LCLGFIFFSCGTTTNRGKTEPAGRENRGWIGIPWLWKEGNGRPHAAGSRAHRFTIYMKAADSAVRSAIYARAPPRCICCMRFLLRDDYGSGDGDLAPPPRLSEQYIVAIRLDRIPAAAGAGRITNHVAVSKKKTSAPVEFARILREVFGSTTPIDLHDGRVGGWRGWRRFGRSGRDRSSSQAI